MPVNIFILEVGQQSKGPTRTNQDNLRQIFIFLRMTNPLKQHILDN